MNNPFANIMQQMQKVQEDIKKAQQELAEFIVTGEAGAGMVKITTNGNGDTLTIDIDENVYRENKAVLQDLIVAACNDAKVKRERLKSEKLKQYLASMGLPVNFNFPFMA